MYNWEKKVEPSEPQHKEGVAQILLELWVLVQTVD